MQINNVNNQPSFGMNSVVVQGSKRFKNKIAAIEPQILEIGGNHVFSARKPHWYSRATLAVLSIVENGEFISIKKTGFFSPEEFPEIARELSYILDRDVNEYSQVIRELPGIGSPKLRPLFVVS